MENKVRFLAHFGFCSWFWVVPHLMKLVKAPKARQKLKTLTKVHTPKAGKNKDT